MKLTRRQEKFTLNLLAGMTQREAYLQAGYSAKPSMAVIDVNACRLAQNTKVLLRQAELNQKAESDKVAGVEERKRVLTEILRARQTDFMTCSADGVWMHDIGTETLNVAGLKKIRTSTMPFGDKESNLQIILTEVELIDPVKAIAELNKMDGAYAPEKHANLNIDLEAKDLTDEELLSIIHGRSSRGILPAETSPG